MRAMQLRLLALASGLVLRQKLPALQQGPVVRTGVEPDVLPNAHPFEWQACAAADACPMLDTVPHDCFEFEGEMTVHPQCFQYTCELTACVKGEATVDQPANPQAAEVCAPVKEEIWDRVSRKGFDVEEFLGECSAGTFTCLLQCPDLHAFLADEHALDRCHGGSVSRMYCEAWLGRVKTCIDAHGECGASFFGRVGTLLNEFSAALAPTTAAVNVSANSSGNATAATSSTTAANSSNATAANSSNASVAAEPLTAEELATAAPVAVDESGIEELRNLTRQMNAVVRASQEAFESTFMSACHPVCEPGEQCIHGKCIYRPFETRHTDKIGGTHLKPDWWDHFAQKRPNHPQRDHWNKAVAAGREPHRFGGL